MLFLDMDGRWHIPENNALRGSWPARGGRFGRGVRVVVEGQGPQGAGGVLWNDTRHVLAGTPS